MGLFDKMKMAVGIGGAKVEIQIEKGPYPLGGYASGKVVLKGGKAEQKCKGILVTVRRTEVVRVRDDQGNSRNEDRTSTVTEENLANYEFTVSPDSTQTFDFSIAIPNEEGPSLSFDLVASADIPGAIDPSQTVKLPTTRAAAATAQSVPQLLATAKRLYDTGSDKYTEAEALLRQVLGFEPKNADALLMLAKTIDYRNGAQAVEVWKQYLDLVPADSRAWSDFARNAQYRSAYEEALQYNQKACSLAPQSSEFWNDRADLFEKLNKLDEAVSCCDRAVTGDAGSAWHHIHKAKLLVKMGRNDLAEQAFRAAGEKGETYILLDVLDGLDALGIDATEELVGKAIAANAGDPQPFWVKAEFLLKKNDAAGANAVLDGALDKAWESEWGRSNLWCMKGKALEASQDRAGAKLAYQRAVKEYKDNTEAARRLKAM